MWVDRTDYRGPRREALGRTVGSACYRSRVVYVWGRQIWLRNIVEQQWISLIKLKTLLLAITLMISQTEDVQTLARQQQFSGTLRREATRSSLE